MPWLFGGILALFGNASSQAAKAYAMRLAMTAIYVTASIASIGLLFTAMGVVLSNIYVTVPSIVVDVWGWFMPTNAFPCLAAILSAKILRAFHDFRMKIMTIKVMATK